MRPKRWLLLMCLCLVLVGGVFAGTATVTVSDSKQVLSSEPFILESAQFPRPSLGAKEDGGASMDIPYFEDIVSSAGLSGIRINTNWDDKYPSYQNTSVPSWYQGNTTLLKEVNDYYLDKGETVILEFHSLPSGLAVANTTWCSAGSGSCYPASRATYRSEFLKFFELIVPNPSDDNNVVVTPCNEPELAQFFGNNLPRNSSNAVERGLRCGRLAADMRTVLDANGRGNVTVGLPDITMRHYTESDGTANENDTNILLENALSTVGTCTGYALTMHAYSDSWQIGGFDEPQTYAEYFSEAYEQHFNSSLDAGLSCIFDSPVYITEGFLQDASLNNESQGAAKYQVESTAAYLSLLSQNASISLMQYGGYQLISGGCTNPSYPEYPKCWDSWSPPYLGDYNRSPILAMFDLNDFLLGGATERYDLDVRWGDGVTGLITNASNVWRAGFTNVNASATLVSLDVSGTRINNFTSVSNGTVFKRSAGSISFVVPNVSTEFYTISLSATGPFGVSISNVSVVVTNDSATITWRTNESANASVNYGLTSSLGSVVSVKTLQLSQSVVLSNLTNNTLYFYNVTSCNAAGNCTVSGPRNFTTQDNPVPDPDNLADIALAMIVAAGFILFFFAYVAFKLSGVDDDLWHQVAGLGVLLGAFVVSWIISGMVVEIIPSSGSLSEPATMLWWVTLVFGIGAFIYFGLRITFGIMLLAMRRREERGRGDW